MIQAYAIYERTKFTECDLTVELYGCNIECRYCCSAYGKRLPPRYRGCDEILERISAVAAKNKPQLMRFTGGEFSIYGKDAIELYLRLASTTDLPIVIETNMTIMSFYEALALTIAETGIRPPIFIVSVKAQSHVTRGHYDTDEVVANIRRLYKLFPSSYIAHGFIGFGDGFRQALFHWFPELLEHEDRIEVEHEGRFRFESLRISSGGRDLYYFDQRIKKYRVGSRR